MRTRHIAALLAAACLSLTACEDTGTPAASNKPTPAVTETVTAAPAEKSEPPAAEPAETIAVPDFVGMGLQEAQDAAQAEGFFLLTSHDDAGAGRMQAFDRNWQVCSQNYAAGKTIPADTKLDFGAVKLGESCP